MDVDEMIETDEVIDIEAVDDDVDSLPTTVASENVFVSPAVENEELLSLQPPSLDEIPVVSPALIQPAVENEELLSVQPPSLDVEPSAVLPSDSAPVVLPTPPTSAADTNETSVAEPMDAAPVAEPMDAAPVVTLAHTESADLLPATGQVAPVPPAHRQPQQQIVSPPFDEVRKMRRGNVVPLFLTFATEPDLDPLAAFAKLRGPGNCYLLEYTDAALQLTHSVIGTEPYRTIQANDGVDPLALLEPELGKFEVDPAYALSPPILNGAAVGYVGYDCVRCWEARVARHELQDAPPSVPDAVLMLGASCVSFDHRAGTTTIVALCSLEADRCDNYERAQQRIVDLKQRLLGPPVAPPADGAGSQRGEAVSNVGRDGYEAFVGKLKQHIVDGDIIQTVPSQRVARPTSAHAFSVYRQLRALNPSRYMFYLELPAAEIRLVGASPELLLQVGGDRTLVTHPIAGTRHRGATPADDDRLAAELLDDVKERAEHIMLVDLGRNDLNRVCQPLSTKVDSLMQIERYSHVMHIVSQLSGKLRPECTVFDAFRSIFPAGTLSGAPKVMAMELIAQLERQRRGPYGGAVGYFAFTGEADLCIAIRMALFKHNTAYLQAGAGIVFDSEPAAEYQETLNKMAAVMRAIDLAEARGHPLPSSKPESSDVEMADPADAPSAAAADPDSDAASAESAVAEAAAAAEESKPEPDAANPEPASASDAAATARESAAAAFHAPLMSIVDALPTSQLPRRRKPRPVAAGDGNVTLLIDNYDSFTWNLYQYVSQLGSTVVVWRNDETTVDKCLALKPARVIISPGPGAPKDAGVSAELVKALAGKVPILGVCLGHQVVFELFGGTVSHAGEIVHGKTSRLEHDSKGVFADVPNEIQVIRYHSLAGVPDTLPDTLEVTARSQPGGIIQGIRHKTYKIEGVQFHPESIKTEFGMEMIKNFLNMTGGTW
eukprot:TRINITY_DN1024_c0_g1_i2.p1 TRINITY_DN1024_c0_g1~~TRINITY_DN1024_c0_g1_i2.p1  ORF type:complete len:958 (-),score=355.15 TRINITY_DN1024_c0_g1_i2:173-3013(-)